MNIRDRPFAIGLMVAGSTLLGACEKDSDKDDEGVCYEEMVLNAIYVVNFGFCLVFFSYIFFLFGKQ